MSTIVLEKSCDLLLISFRHRLPTTRHFIITVILARFNTYISAAISLLFFVLHSSCSLKMTKQ